MTFRLIMLELGSEKVRLWNINTIVAESSVFWVDGSKEEGAGVVVWRRRGGCHDGLQQMTVGDRVRFLISRKIRNRNPRLVQILMECKLHHIFFLSINEKKVLKNCIDQLNCELFFFIKSQVLNQDNRIKHCWK